MMELGIVLGVAAVLYLAYRVLGGKIKAAPPEEPATTYVCTECGDHHCSCTKVED